MTKFNVAHLSCEKYDNFIQATCAALECRSTTLLGSTLFSAETLCLRDMVREENVRGKGPREDGEGRGAKFMNFVTTCALTHTHTLTEHLWLTMFHLLQDPHLHMGCQDHLADLGSAADAEEEDPAL